VRFSKRPRFRPFAGRQGNTAIAIDQDKNQTVNANTQNAEGPIYSAARPPAHPALRALVEMQRALHTDRTPVNEDDPTWADLTMDALVTALEHAMRAGWEDAAEALTDAGRVLQTYEDAGRPEAVRTDLRQATALLQRLVGESAAGAVGEAARHQWRVWYGRATAKVTEVGLTLVRDDDEGEKDMSTRSNQAANTAHNLSGRHEDNDAMPFDMPEFSETGSPNDTDELPTLDELPPLESLLDPGTDIFKLEEPKPAPTPAKTNRPARETAHAAAPPPAELNEPDLFPEFETQNAQPQTTAPREDEPTREPQLQAEAPQASKPAHEQQPEAATSAKPVEVHHPHPPRIVLDILDRLSEDLNRMQNASSEERALFLERLEGGLLALEREARGANHDLAQQLCEAFRDLCSLARATNAELTDQFLDLGFGFGGAYTEAVDDGETENVAVWKLECDILNHNLSADQRVTESPPQPLDDGIEDTPDSPVAIQDEAQPAEETAAVNEVSTKLPDRVEVLNLTDAKITPVAAPTPDDIIQMTPYTSEDDQVEEEMPTADDFAAGLELGEDETIAEPTAPEAAVVESETITASDAPQPEPAAETVAPVVVEEPIATPEPAPPATAAIEAPMSATPVAAPETPAPRPTAATKAAMPEMPVDDGEEPLSRRLLESAQRAAMEGDGAAAKFYALQAAANIAKEEAIKAERYLKLTEEKYQRSLASIQGARKDVKGAEEGVLKAATAVSECESDLGSAREITAQIAQALDDVQANIAELDRQIALLLKKKEEEQARADETREQLEKTRSDETTIQSQLIERREMEANSRVQLESARQKVKEHQRLSAEIEAEMESARETMTSQRASLHDIELTIKQLCGENTDGKDDELLF
jgi:hypothetical protein